VIIRAYLKTKKSTDFLQRASKYKAKNAGIFCGFRGSLTQQMLLFVKKDKNSDFSDAL